MIRIAYFSGTGGTARAAACFAEAFQTRGTAVSLTEIRVNAKAGTSKETCVSVETALSEETDISEETAIPEKEELLLLMFPVYAMNAPAPVDRWIENLTEVSGIRAAVVSVSGGGEVFPNRACRRRSIRSLEEKGYRVVCEDMLIMPANLFVELPESVALQLLRILPAKTEKIADRILSGAVSRRKADILSRGFAKIFTFQKKSVTKIGKKMQINDSCTHCGWCGSHCPTGNIDCSGGKPSFSNKCTFCLRCIYGCPANAITIRVPKFVIFKNGYDLEKLEKAAGIADDQYLKDLPGGILWKAVREYLTEDQTRDVLENK